MDALFSVLDGLAALWLSLFSPRRYLRIVVATKLMGKGARNFFEAYVRVNLVPALLLGALVNYNATLPGITVESLLATENLKRGLPEGHLQGIYHHLFADPLAINITSLLQNKNLVSLSFLVGTLVTYYSLSRSREFRRNWRKLRHGLQLITMNALIILVLEIAQSAVQSILALSVDVDSARIPQGAAEDAVVLYAMRFANGALETSAVQIGLSGLFVFLQLLMIVVSIRIMVVQARSLRIRFWRMLWLQLRFALPVAIIQIVLGAALALGFKMVGLLVWAMALLLVTGLVIILLPSGREWVSRGATPVRERRVVKPRLARIRVLEGSLAGTVVPVSSRLVLGRDPAQSAIVFPTDGTLVSRRHCDIRFDPKSGLFEVRDLGSRNGTYVFDGVNPARRIPPDRPERISPGQNVFVGSSRERLIVEVI